jgi:hypothetical protein
MTKKKITIIERDNHEGCTRCFGFGWWPIGRLSPIGEKDYEEWKLKIIKCPWCGMGTDDEDERYRTLKEIMEKEIDAPEEVMELELGEEEEDEH